MFIIEKCWTLKEMVEPADCIRIVDYKILGFYASIRFLWIRSIFPYSCRCAKWDGRQCLWSISVVFQPQDAPSNLQALASLRRIFCAALQWLINYFRLWLPTHKQYFSTDVFQSMIHSASILKMDNVHIVPPLPTIALILNLVPIDHWACCSSFCAQLSGTGFHFRAIVFSISSDLCRWTKLQNSIRRRF